jgi:peptidoglycan/LPS O-acetylase OafA/YrhL
VWAANLAAVAVGLFYALSGYLIGRILLDRIDSPSISGWLHFMGCRWTRTLPLYAAVLAVGASIVQPGTAELLRYATLTQNLLHAPKHSALNWFLLPTWSLTVEESFYLAFASVLLAAASIFGRRAVWPVIALFLTAPIAFRIAHYGEVDTYFAALGWLCP